MPRANNLGTRGARLWGNLLAQDATLADVKEPRREVALSACRAADRVERLELLADKLDPIYEGDKGPVVHPIFAEVRQQEAILARLVAALRLPDEATGKKPQHRGVRGVQQPSTVSSLDRARARRTGT